MAILSKPKQSLLVVEALSFLLIGIISFMDEYFKLPELLFGSGNTNWWHEVIVETGLVLLVAIPTLFLTNRMLRLLNQLEQFIIVCAWCRKIKIGHDWVSFEKFLEEKTETLCSHGICQECVSTMLKSAPKKK